MENSYSKRKGIIGILIIIVCLCLCIGATYAYFTDVARSRNNKIKAGSLKIDLELLDKSTSIWNSIKGSEAPVFDYEYWEPGYTDVKILRVTNKGTLALQWNAVFISEAQVSALADVIEVYVKTDSTEFGYPASRDEALTWTKVGTLKDFINTDGTIASGTLTAQNESAYFGIVLHMSTTVENEYQEQALEAFDIQINATQVPYEPDAFDDQYDTSAKLPCNHPETKQVVAKEPTADEHGQQNLVCTTCDEVLATEDVYFTFEKSADESYYTLLGKTADFSDTDVVIPATYNNLPVKAIGDSAFYRDFTITSVTIPDSVTTIGNSAFYSCGLKDITFGDGVTTIGEKAFYQCAMLTSIDIPDSVTVIGEDAFTACYRLQYNSLDNALYLGNDANKYMILMMNNDDLIDSFVFNKDTKIIYSMSFNNCDNLTSIVIPDSVTYIVAGAFKKCTALTNIDVEEGNVAYQSIAGNLYSKDGTVLVAYAAGKCQTDTSFIIPDSVTTIGGHAFSNCQFLTSITMPNHVTTIGNGAFSGCSGLTGEFTIPDSVTTIGNSAFSYCSGLTGELIIPNSVTAIGAAAFSYCSGLTSVIIPDTITTLKASTFSDCSSLREITIPNSVTVIGDGVIASCPNLERIIFTGTRDEWEAIKRDEFWSYGTGGQVICSDDSVT